MAKEKEGTLLVVDDNRSILSAVQLLMGNYFARVLTLPSPNQLLTTLRREPVDVILLDMNFSAGINTGNEGFYWLQEIHRNRPDIKVVLFTAYADIDVPWISSSSRGTTNGWSPPCRGPTIFRVRSVK